MNTTLKISLELDDVRPVSLNRVALGVAQALTRAENVRCSAPVGSDDTPAVLTLDFDSLNRNEAERTRDCIVGAIRPLVRRVVGTHTDRRED